MSTKTALKLKTIQPSGNRLFIKPIVQEELTPGGILVPSATARGRESQRGLIVAVGPGMYTHDGKRIPMPFQRGDLVLYPKSSGYEVVIGSETYLIVTEPDILGTEVEADEREGSKRTTRRA